MASESEKTPDVIVLDLMMPVMSGWSFRVAQSERDLGAPLWALSKGLEEVARYSAARGAGRDVKQLKGYANLWELRKGPSSSGSS